LIIKRTLEASEREITMQYVRYNVLLALLYWFLHLDDLIMTSMISAGQPQKLDFDTQRTYEEKCKKNRDQAFHAYASLVLMELGQQTGLSMWGGLRVCRKPISISDG